MAVGALPVPHAQAAVVPAHTAKHNNWIDPFIRLCFASNVQVKLIDGVKVMQSRLASIGPGDKIINLKIFEMLHTSRDYFGYLSVAVY